MNGIVQILKEDDGKIYAVNLDKTNIHNPFIFEKTTAFNHKYKYAFVKQGKIMSMLSRGEVLSALLDEKTKKELESKQLNNLIFKIINEVEQ